MDENRASEFTGRVLADSAAAGLTGHHAALPAGHGVPGRPRSMKGSDTNQVLRNRLDTITPRPIRMRRHRAGPDDGAVGTG